MTVLMLYAYKSTFQEADRIFESFYIDVGFL